MGISRWFYGIRRKFWKVAVRELKEETNLEIDELELIKVLSGKDTYREYPNGDGKIAHEIKKEDLINKSYLLKENGIVMDIKNFTVNELIDKLKGIIKTRWMWLSLYSLLHI